MILDWNTAQQLIRIVLQMVAGWLLSAGFITEDMQTTLVGAGVSLVGIIWWAVWDRHRPSG